MFNIADGGFTELHSLWSEEKTKGFSPALWGRHHDYWLLKGVVTHGYCRWSEICGDVRFSLLNKPFQPDEFVSDNKSRFFLKRFKLLEQALAVEEQLHRASNAGLVQDPNHSVMQLHSRFTDLDCLTDGHQYLVKECMNGDKNSILLLRKALGKMEELLMEMKSDVSRLPSELSKIPSVSNQLKMDEISTLSKLANKEGEDKTAAKAMASSVITHAASATAATTTTSLTVSSSQQLKVAEGEHVVVVQDKGGAQPELLLIDQSGTANHTGAVAGQYPVAYAAQGGAIVQAVYPSTSDSTTAGSGLAVQPTEGMLMYTVATTKGTQFATVQQAGTAQTSIASSQGAYAINVPAAYVDLQGQTVQLVPVSGQLSGAQLSGQQVVYWPGVVQGGQSTSQALAVGSQLAVVQDGSQAILQPVQYTSAPTTTSQSSSIITID